MINEIKQGVVSLVYAIHVRVFGYEMGGEMRNFLRHLSWSFLGMIFSSGLLFLGSVMIGRILGPEEYGKYNLVIAISSMAVVFMFLGFDTTAVKFISSTNNEEDQDKFMSNSVWFLLLSSATLFLLSYIFSDVFARILNVDINLIFIAFFFAVISAFKTLFDAFARAFHKFKYQAIVKIFESIAFVVFVVGAFIFGNRQNYFSFLIPSLVGSVLVIFSYSGFVRSKLRSWDWGAFLVSKSYLKLTLGVSLIGILIGTLDRFFIAKYLGMKELGLYSAYLMSSAAIVSQLALALSNVFFPAMNRQEDKRGVMLKVDKLMKVFSLPLFASVFLLSFLILKIFGSQYGINYTYISFVSLVSLLQIWGALYGAITTSSHELFWLTTKVYYFKPIFIMALYLLVYYTNGIGLFSVFSILTASYLYDILNVKLAFKMIK